MRINIGRMGKDSVAYSGLDASFFVDAWWSRLEHSMSVDWDRRRRFERMNMLMNTANGHEPTCTRKTCSCSQTAVQWNQWRLSVHTYSNGREHYSDSWLQYINSYMSTPGNTATYRQPKVVRPLLGANLQCISHHTTESTH